MFCSVCKKKEAVFVCSCGIYLCIDHLGIHLESEATHRHFNLKLVLTKSESQVYKKDLLEKFSKIESSKISILSMTKALIQQIEALSKNMLNQLEKQAEEYLRLISLSEMTEKDVSEIREALKSDLTIKQVKLELCECIKEKYSEEILLKVSRGVTEKPVKHEKIEETEKEENGRRELGKIREGSRRKEDRKETGKKKEEF